MRWSEDATLEFVKLYLKHECLWNPPNPGYKKKLIRDKAYSEICSEFKHIKTLTIPDVRLKIRTLRTTYIQQLNKIQEKSSPESAYEPSLVWFNEMDRCLKHIIPNNRHSSYETQETEIDSSAGIWVNIEPENNLDGDSQPDPLVTNSFDDFESAESLTPIKIEGSKYSQSNKKIKKKKRLKHGNLSTLTLKDSIFVRKKWDEYDIYGKFIASQLRGMNVKTASRLQLQIQSLVSAAKLAEME
ncbi:jg12251 [Pararge aegeria aegeria]|uniref:Jg12251 protein n=2 Tax=Pararge aegeria TaxID=116150 RepID=A0A8S4S6Z6_9NEOP|nr:jg12251 [Pararge aegeria aegeria]